MEGTRTATRPTVEVGTPVRFDRPDSWAAGEVIAVAPERTIVGSSWSREHGSSGVVWGDSSTHVAVTIRWSDGSHVEAGAVDVVSVGHSFAGTAVDTTRGGWPAGWIVG